MTRSARLLVLAQLAGCLLLAIVAPAVALPSPRQLIGLFTFAALAVLSEALATDFSVGPQRKVQSSVVFIPMLACALVFPLAYVLGAVVTAITVIEVYRRTYKAPWLLAFNVTQYVLAFGLGAYVYGLIRQLSSAGEIDYVAFFSMALVFFALNLLLIACALRLWRLVPIATTLKQTIGPAGGNLVFDILSSPIAVLIALVYVHFHAGALLAVVLPLLLVRSSYASKLKLERVNKDILTVLVKAIETRDPHTSGHSIRVSALARTIAKDLGLNRWTVDEVERAALLHDIGKIEALYAPVISKPYSLTPEERALIKSHATKGADLLLELSAFNKPLIMAVRHHHERYDGTGYPDGLAGEDIPLTSRIIMVCDSVDAMLSDRPYRRALPVSAVEAELRACSGTQFDPRIVEVVLKNGTVRKVAVTSPGAPDLKLAAVGGD